MRENMGLYRGKVKNGTRWVFGPLLFVEEEPAIYDTTDPESTSVWMYGEAHLWGAVPVIPETVGQFTGLSDLHGYKIFEGDIIKIRFESDSFTHPAESIVWYDIAKVFWSSEHYGWYAAFASGEELSLWEYDDPHDVEIVGNIHDNSELEVVDYA